MKSGFTLLEFLLATALAAMLSVFLLSSLWSINRYVYLIDDLTGLDEKAALINTQLERSLSGAFIPVQAVDDQQQEAAPQAEAPNPKAPQPNVPEKKEEPKELLKKIFFSENKDKNLSYITCITNNPLEVYWGEQWGRAVPRIARVMYRLEQEKLPNKQKKLSYKLVRKEAYELDAGQFDTSSSIKSYDLVVGIKSCTIVFGYFKESAEEEKKESKPELLTADQWDSDAKRSQKETQQSPIPQYAKISYELWDSSYKRSRTYTYVIYITGGQPAPAKAQKNKSPQDEKKNEKPPAQPGTPKPTIPGAGQPKGILEMMRDELVKSPPKI